MWCVALPLLIDYEDSTDSQLIFSVAMIASFVQVFIESFQRATHPQEQEVVDLSKVGIA